VADPHIAKALQVQLITGAVAVRVDLWMLAQMRLDRTLQAGFVDPSREDHRHSPNVLQQPEHGDFDAGPAPRLPLHTPPKQDSSTSISPALRKRGSLYLLKQIQLLRVNSALFQQGVEVDDVLPVFSSGQVDRHRLDLFCLYQRQRPDHVIEHTKPARECHQSSGTCEKMHFTDSVIKKLEAEFRCDISIRLLLPGQDDIKSSAPAACLEGAAIGSLHEAGSATGYHDEFASAILT
jgi:hypothetical protein